MNWNKENLTKLKKNINKKSNKELAEMFNMSIGGIRKVISKHGLKRTKKFEKELLSRAGKERKGENHPGWKGGISKEHYRYKKQQKEKYPEKVNARQVVYRAVKSGKLIKPNKCEHKWCRETIVEAHHTDYTKPLDVVWLCKKHHLQADQELRNSSNYTQKNINKQ